MAPEAGWTQWRAERDRLFATHPQTALDPADVASFSGLPYYSYDPAWRILAPIVDEPDRTRPVRHSADGETPFRRIGRAQLELPTGEVSLSVYWLDAYGGGLFVPFRDATSGRTTYGGGRYLLDTVKGADLGEVDERIVFDFNFAYHPSCVYSARWSCPLAPPENHLEVSVEAGERLGSPAG